MNKLFAFLIFALLGLLNVVAENAPMIVKDGKANAQIVIAAENRPRMATLAALELQRGIQKISGARLPIVTASDANVPVKIYVGKSPEAEKLGVSEDGLKYGAFRIKSGENWLILMGSDFDFIPMEPWASRHTDIPRAQKEWDEKVKGKTDSSWLLPWRGVYKSKWGPKDFEQILDSYYGEGSSSTWKSGGNSLSGFWCHDEGGTLNAVCHFLNTLGMRWYMPESGGEVIPAMSSIPLLITEEEVRPDYAIRHQMYYNYSGFSFDEVLWNKRLGMNFGHEKFGIAFAHGLHLVHGHELMQKKHPEYYALINGKRDTEHRTYGTPCLMSEGLFKETISFARFLFDEYDLPVVDIWPGDGLKTCQCDLCKGKDAPELVWNFADRVSKEIYKTHPDRIINCGAYANYRQSPDTIKKFSPNLSVSIANRGCPMFDDPEKWADYVKDIESWREKIAAGRILRTENIRYHIYGETETEPVPFPIIFPHTMAKDLKYLNGIAMGLRGEMSQVGGEWKAIGLGHITIYVQSRFLWDADQDVEPLLDEYYKLFYGPAAAKMKEAFTFAEQNYNRKDTSRSGGRNDPRNVSLKVSLRFRDLLDEARVEAGDTVYGKRIEKIISELEPRDSLVTKYGEKEKNLKKSREKAPLAVGVLGSDLSKAAEYTLKDVKTAEPADVKTKFKIVWDKNALILEIVCDEPDMKGLADRTTSTVWDGDHIAIALETQNHSYYKMEINPNGEIVEGDPVTNRWKSLADVKVEKGTDSWRLNVRIPTVGADEASSDPMHRVSGSMPSVEDPWYFNIARVRNIKESDRQAFSTRKDKKGKGDWYSVSKFGRLEIK